MTIISPNVQIGANCWSLTDDDWNDDGEATTAILADSPIDGEALFTHEIGYGLGLWAPEIGGAGQPGTQNYTSCTAVVEGFTVFGGPNPIDIEAVCCAYECSDIDPAAVVLGFSVADGTAQWAVESEFRTASYVIEGAVSAEGPWHVVAQVNATNQNNYSVEVSGSPWDYFRLVEVERGGQRLIHGLASPSEGSYSRPDRRVTATQTPVRRPAPGSGHASNVANQTQLHIYTNAAMQQAVQTEIADFWSNYGYSTNVEIVPDVTAVGADYLRSYVKSDISLKAQGGATYFLLVGDAVDWDEFQGATWPVPWDTIRAAYLSSGNYNEPESNNVIPTFVVWDTLPRGEGNMSWWAPYWFADVPYADLDDDGIADVVVTRLPFTDSADVYGYATKLAGGMWQANTVVSLVEDTEWIVGSGDGYDALGTASTIEGHLPVSSAVSHLYGSAEPLISARNTATADLLNAVEPDLVLLVGARSNKYFPARFMDKFNTVNPWQMGMLTTSKPLCVIAASCGTAGFARSEYDPLDHPVAHDFLAEADKGAVAWIGPTAGTWQRANRVVAGYILDELYAIPGRPGGEAFRMAIERVLVDFAGDQQILDTAASYVYLGDPLITYPAIPTAVGPATITNRLEPSYPNPFNPTATIAYSIAQGGSVRLTTPRGTSFSSYHAGTGLCGCSQAGERKTLRQARSRCWTSSTVRGGSPGKSRCVALAFGRPWMRSTCSMISYTS